MIKKKLVAMIMSALVVASTPVHAYTYQSIHGTDQTFTSLISGEAGVSLPGLTIAYTVGAVIGPSAGVSGTLTIDNSSVTAGTVVIPSTGSYTVDANVNLSDLTFSKPGEYVWPITVNTSGSSSSSTVPGFTITDAATVTKYLHVFIEDDQTSQQTDGTLKQGTVYLSTSNASSANAQGQDAAKTDSLFAATYETKSLTINPAVAGNMGDKTMTFVYTINLSECNNIASLKGIRNNDPHPSERITVSNGSATKEITGLTHGDSYTISGIPGNAHYQVSQNSIGDYSTTILVTKP